MADEEKKSEETKVPPAMPRPALADFDRITGRILIHHERFEMEPRSIESVFHRYLKEKEQIFNREMTVDEHWTPIELFWMADKASILVIENPVRGRVVLPTQEEQEELEKKVLIVTYRDQQDGFIIRPGLPFIAEPQNHNNLLIRSAYGQAKAIITAFPK